MQESECRLILILQVSRGLCNKIQTSFYWPEFLAEAKYDLFTSNVVCFKNTL